MRRPWILLLLLGCGEAPAVPVVVAPPEDVAPPAPDSFTIVALPDTQYYSQRYPHHFERQTEWIAEQAEARRIRFVVHLGDVVQNNAPREWKAARKAMAVLDGKVPYSLLPGNHDLGPLGRAGSRRSLLGNVFPLSHFRKMATFGGVYDGEPDRPENSFHRFEAGGRNWLVLSLEFGPRDGVLRWANRIVSAHPDHRVIVATHAYLHGSGERYDRRKPELRGSPHGWNISREPGGANEGEEMWKKLASKHANIVLVLSGHASIASRRSDPGEDGRTVHQMMVNYQAIGEGGNGWLRLLEFSNDGTSLRVVDYSPVLDRYNTHPRTAFTLRWEDSHP